MGVGSVYWEHYGLREKAFGNTPDPRFLFLNDAYDEALSTLLYAVEERDSALLVGDVGMGKSLLIRALVDRLDDSCEVVVIVNPRLSPMHFLRTVAQEFGIQEPKHNKADLLASIYERLLEIDREGHTAVLIIDEAQLIPTKAVFDEIRLMTNFQLDDRNLLVLIFIGQLELKTRLRHRAYRALTQRIGVTVQLEPLSAAQTFDYIKHRLWVAGMKEGPVFPVFTEQAVAAIHAKSSGVPRVVNTLATHSLREGFGRGLTTVDETVVKSVANSMLFPPG